MYKITLLFLSLIPIFQSCNNLSDRKLTERKIVLADSTSFYSIHVEYPEDARDKEGMMSTFVSERFKTKKEEWKTGGEIQKEEALVTMAFPDRAGIRYTYDMEFETLFADSLDIISYVFTTYEYTGGANGNSTVNSFSFGKHKKNLGIQDILDFNNNKDIELTKVLAETAMTDTSLFFKDFVYEGLGLTFLKADGKTLDKDKCNCDGFFFGSNFQNFAVKNDGICFYFDKYAIAPGAAGVTSITLSWSQLKPYLKESFKKQP